MVGWTIWFASEAVARELRDQSPGLQADFLRIGDMLKVHGPQRVGMPYVRPLGNKLWEMRLHDESGIARAIHVAAENRRLIVSHVFRKTTQKTPPRALKTALKRLKELNL
jgi:phage-related protein